MVNKFYPHFCGYEDDLMQEMMIILIKSIRRINRGEIRSEQNYIITALKYASFKMAKKLITYDRSTYYLEDLTHKGKSNFEKSLDWQDLFSMGCMTCETLLSTFESYEERYMVLILIRQRGYSKRGLRKELSSSWLYISTLEERVKEKLGEIIKMYVGN